MSAFVCSDEHINALVNYGVAKRASYYFNPQRVYFTTATASEIGQILLDENYRSVNARYRGEEGDPHAFKFAPSIHAQFKAVDVLKAISCLDYQSCETEDWSQTEAYAILDGLKDCAIRNLPGYESSKGWNL